MKKTLAFLFVLAFGMSVFAQAGPMTQTEYSKMIFGLKKGEITKDAIIEALRKRGIGFVLTDGVRGFTRSNSGNDEELKRTLEEAGRRQKDPEGTKLPNTAEADQLLEKAKTETSVAIEQMPDFVVKQIISRSEAYAGTGNWKPVDTVTIAVSYSDEKGEQYKVLALNGAPVQSEKGNNYSGLEGSTTSGEFVEALEKLFKPDSKTKFTLLTTDVIRSQPTLVFDYEILLENNKNDGVGFKTPNGANGFSFTSVPAGRKGRIWIDRKNARVLRIEFEATDIPKDFRVRAYTSTIDYDWVDIAGERVLLPISSDNRFTSAEGRQLFQSRNFIRFKNYQKFGSEVKILDDDVQPVPAPSPEKP